MTSSHRRATNSFRCVPVPSSFLPRFLFLRFHPSVDRTPLFRANFFPISIFFWSIGDFFSIRKSIFFFVIFTFIFIEIDNFDIAYIYIYFFFWLISLEIVNKILSVCRVFLFLLLKDSTVRLLFLYSLLFLIYIICVNVCVKRLIIFERFFESNLSYILLIWVIELSIRYKRKYWKEYWIYEWEELPRTE